MFGTLRLILALLVVASHVEVAHEVDLGATAVTIFFLLSGYVMTATIRRYYARPRDYGLFMLDRAGRIFPQYLLWTMACVLWVVFFDPAWRPLSWQAVMENVLLLPGMYSVYEFRPWLTGVKYVTQAWSLSLEWHFYMLLPLVLVSPRVRSVFGWGSLGIFTLATLGVISPYLHSYHLLPGVLFIFLLGSVAYDEMPPRGTEQSSLLRPFVFLLLLGVVANSLKTLHLPYTAEVYLGLLAGVPLLLWLARLPAHPLDTWLGNLSYGVFLCHNLVLAVLYHYHLVQGRWSALVWASFGSMICAGLAYYGVERPFVAWRHALRRRSAPTG